MRPIRQSISSQAQVESKPKLARKLRESMK